MKKKDFNQKCKIALFIEIILVIIGIFCYKCFATTIEELKTEIQNAEYRLKYAEQRLKDINPIMFDIFVNRKWSNECNRILQIYMSDYKKEYLEYMDAYGRVEELLELYFYAWANDISNGGEKSE